MLRITQNSNAAGAKSYYSTSDYYSEGQELAGLWRGKGAEQLGLSGAVRADEWDALCDNKDPVSGETLTVRQRPGRRIGYDFNFHVPKSVSVLYALTGDQRILEAFRESVNQTMNEIESEAKTRVRSGGRNEDRVTGNLAWGEFVHFTARPVDGVPDPHLHAHAFVFNTTWDETEQRWKAGQFADLKRDAPYFEAVFHSNLSHRLAEAGLPIQRTRKGWEIEGIAKSALTKFSRRTSLIEETAKVKGLDRPEDKGDLGARTRERKQTELSMDELRQEWRSRLTSAELDSIEGLQFRSHENRTDDGQRDAERAVELALQHCFERSAVVPERTAQTEALKRAYGTASPDKVLVSFAARPLLTADRGTRRFITAPEILAEEDRMLAFARNGRGTQPQLGSPGHELNRKWLNKDQRAAVEHVLNSSDRVMLIRGAAGTGKTTMMQEAVEGIEAGGKKVFTFAPSADASRGVLREEGFGDADTVARLLIDPQMQERVRGQVVWIDEAGLIGSRTMGHVFDAADQLDARVVLSGDTRQHGSVERGAALRLLETEAGLKPAEIRDIQRQQDEYKQVVQALSDGRVEDGFHHLDQMGWIREVAPGERYKQLAADYIEAIKAGKSALVVSPTHLEGEWITSEIREGLERAGELEGAERKFEVLEPAYLTEAQRRDAVNYLPGDVLVYHQNAPGVRRGSRLTFGVDPVDLSHAPRFQVFHRRAMQIRPGETIRISRNGKTTDGRHDLNNGALFTVKGFTKQGDIELASTITASGKRRRVKGWTIARDYGHIDFGYVGTSHSSQGKTVDRIFIGESAASFPAASREQFYVSVSRGREQAVIYTDDKESLLEAVRESDDRPTATEFMSLRHRRTRAAVLTPAFEQAGPGKARGAPTLERKELEHER